MLTKKDRENFVAERKRRGMTQEDVGRLLGCSRMSITNWETGRIAQPRTILARAIEDLLREWLTVSAEESEPGVTAVAEEPAFYVPAVLCPHCRARVPGPIQKARCCLNCGHRFAPRRCARCGHVVVSVEAVYCEGCGGAL